MDGIGVEAMFGRRYSARPAEQGADALVVEGKKTVMEPQQPASRKSRADTRSQTKIEDGAVGKALRSAYQQTVGEQVPSDLLDLLGKLD